jgi:Cof subfamily protein (haloacid dehalogenase superfamily)
MSSHRSHPSRDGVPSDPRLVVTDMDGTLLDAGGRIPDDFWPLLAELRKRDIVFAVASGRQFATLSRQFAQDSDGIVFIAENGSFVMRDGAELSSTSLSRSRAHRLVRAVRELGHLHDLGLVWSGRRAAYIERRDSAFVWEADKFFANLEIVDDLTQVAEDPLKLSAFDFEGTLSGSVAVVAAASHPYGVVASTGHWMDIMDPVVHKGVAVRALMTELDVTPDQVIIFGDYLNDLEMLGEASYSYAMANAHPDVLKSARFHTLTNRDGGVIAVLTRLAELVADRPSA